MNHGLSKILLFGWSIFILELRFKIIQRRYRTRSPAHLTSLFWGLTWQVYCLKWCLWSLIHDNDFAYIQFVKNEMKPGNIHFKRYYVDIILISFGRFKWYYVDIVLISFGCFITFRWCYGCVNCQCVEIDDYLRY